MTPEEVRTALANGDGQALRRERYRLMDRFIAVFKRVTKTA